MNTPLVFIIFNRPDTTKVVFEAIRQARPRQLLVVADGPRDHVPGEEERCLAARQVLEGVDWPCEVKTNFSPVNLGCKKRIISGLQWVFDEVEEAIVLEDDVVPDPSFFGYCEELLERYRDDHRVGMINGGNFLRSRFEAEGSYYFTRFGHVWGWASWRRVWRQYDGDLTSWPEKRQTGWLSEHFGQERLAQVWSRIFDDVQQHRVNTWDYQMDYCLWAHGMLAVAPAVNLVSNIGFGADSTHTKEPSVWSEMPRQPLSLPLKHPDRVELCEPADRIEYHNYLPLPWLERKKRRLAKLVKAVKGVFG
ncbi:hemolytic protein HlpA [Geomonas silvestris]|uniref:Hemolytic protein HlpA n=1 Tax=Geomonas silvestris TaxID=2740184 RepID=A0A6V8MNZ7_9BACT|nr:glycosyltransferase family 2 protein [Geomonas silvestris]GFO61607.1 hemolytic protein HlpA [Geomonas silvestris]